MADSISREHRSWNMSRIKSVNTRPEILIRSLLHKSGYRFRLNGRVSKKYISGGVLPGKPDIVFSGYKTVIFVHGCFWHRHEGCKDATIPKTNTEWWLKKLNTNIERDKKAKNDLENSGWKVIIVWECETKNKAVPDLINFLKVEIKNGINQNRN